MMNVLHFEYEKCVVGIFVAKRQFMIAKDYNIKNINDTLYLFREITVDANFS